MILSLMGEFVINVPLVITLPKFLGVTGVLYSVPIADTVTFIAPVLIMIPTMRKLKIQNQ